MLPQIIFIVIIVGLVQVYYSSNAEKCTFGKTGESYSTSHLCRTFDTHRMPIASDFIEMTSFTGNFTLPPSIQNSFFLQYSLFLQLLRRCLH